MEHPIVQIEKINYEYRKQFKRLVFAQLTDSICVPYGSLESLGVERISYCVGKHTR
jgi:hypothetical protein